MDKWWCILIKYKNLYAELMYIQSPINYLPIVKTVFFRWNLANNTQ